MGEESWHWLSDLRTERRTGRSARMLYEVLGDIWVVRRNPYLQDDLLENPKRLAMLIEALKHRLSEIDDVATRSDPDRDNKVVLLLQAARGALSAFEYEFEQTRELRKKVQRTLLAKVTRQRQHQVRRLVACVACDRRHRLACRISIRGPDAGHRR